MDLGYDVSDYGKDDSEPPAPTLLLPIVIRDLSYLPQDGQYHSVVLRMNYNYYQPGTVGSNEGLLCNIKIENDTLYYSLPYSGSYEAAQLYRYGLDLQYKGLTPVSNLDDWKDDADIAIRLLIQQSGFENYEGNWIAGSTTAPICVVDFPLPDLFGMRFNLNENYRAALDAMNVGDKIAVMINGVYILNELVDGESDPVIRTYLPSCLTPEDDSAMALSYEYTDVDIVIEDSVSCLAYIESQMEDYWHPLGVAPIRYDFEEVVRYIKYIDILPQYFSEI